MKNTTKRDDVKWAELLKEAVDKPGMMLSAYSNFHNYSFGNCLLALSQILGRGLEPGPIAPYKKWQELGRQVRRGEKALTLCMPITVKNKNAEGDDDKFKTIFVYKNRWFAMAQTDGDDVTFPALEDWEKAKALEALGVTEVPFEAINGNTQGYASPGKKIAINPIAELPHKTLFHELGHQVLGHVDEKMVDAGDVTPRNIREVEAEAVALICCEALGLEGAEFCRGYIQHWLKDSEISDGSARKIFTAADKILAAGTKGAR